MDETVDLPTIRKIPQVTVPEKYQPSRLEKSIRKFENEEVVTGQILFYGHSDFTRWTGDPNYSLPSAGSYLKDDMTTPAGNKPCINHGFGSSTLYDLCYFYERAVLKWQPKALVIATYSNDGQFSDADEILLLDWLMKQIHEDMPECKVFLLDCPPNPKAEITGDSKINRRMALNEKAASLVSHFDWVTLIEMSKYPDFYKDAASAGTYKNLRTELFLPDNTHLTPEGYKVFTKMLKEALADVLISYDKPV